jgi:uncharacterized protein with HEPN domain
METAIKKWLFDIEEAINSIENYLGTTRDFNLYQSNKMLRRAVERELEIIGEAVSKIHKFDDSIKLSNKRYIIGMRNRVIHGYDKIDDEIVWGTIIRHLPILKAEVSVLIQECNKDD